MERKYGKCLRGEEIFHSSLGGCTHRPPVQQETDGEVVHLLEEVQALFFRLACLPHQCLPKRVVTLDQVIVPLVEALQILDDRDEGELPRFATIAGRTAENKVPDAVEIQLARRYLPTEGMGEEVVNVAGMKGFVFQGILVPGGVLQNDVREAVETLSLLIPVQCGPARGHVHPPVMALSAVLLRLLFVSAVNNAMIFFFL